MSCRTFLVQVHPSQRGRSNLQTARKVLRRPRPDTLCIITEDNGKECDSWCCTISTFFFSFIFSGDKKKSSIHSTFWNRHSFWPRVELRGAEEGRNWKGRWTYTLFNKYTVWRKPKPYTKSPKKTRTQRREKLSFLVEPSDSLFETLWMKLHVSYFPLTAACARHPEQRDNTLGHCFMFLFLQTLFNMYIQYQEPITQ